MPLSSVASVILTAIATCLHTVVSAAGEIEPGASLEARSQAEIVDLAKIDASVIFDHNGSEVLIDREKGLIVYVKPKRSIRGTVRPGQVLFRGSIPDGGRAVGTAYTFKLGCEPAQYAVSGGFVETAIRPTLVLSGQAPVQSASGCEIIGLSNRTKNSRLVFEFLISP